MNVFVVNLYGMYAANGYMVIAAPTGADAVALANSVEQDYSVDGQAVPLPGVRSDRPEPTVLYHHDNPY